MPSGGQAVIDNNTLLIAIAFSSAALMLALLISWSNTRGDRYLISWAAGMACVVVALTTLGLGDGPRTLPLQIGGFSPLITGMALITLGTFQFATGGARQSSIIWLWAVALVSMNLAYLLGWSGPGTVLLNIGCALFMGLSGQHYWQARREFPLQMITSTILFGLMSLSFLACAFMLIQAGTLVLVLPLDNWAEQFNSIMAIVGLTGLGALALTLNQSRITRRHREEAQTDPLTGLLNRRALFDRFAMTGMAPHSAVLMFDIDHFKQINDDQGHGAGDAVIRQFAMVMTRSLRSHDIAARIGGEEFCAILPATSLEEAGKVAERIRRDFQAHPARLISQDFPATVSAGVAASGHGEAFSVVLGRADTALYAAKRSGRNRVTSSAARQVA